MIRSAGVADVPVMRELERAAGRPFADVGMVAVAEDGPPPLERFAAFQRDGRAWVDGDPVRAFVLVEWVDGNVHVEQVSVHPDHAGQRIGAALIEHVAGWARDRRAPALTLTTFADVPWNGPYYARLGFRETAETPGLQRIRDAERAHGLDRWPRICMRRELQP